MDIKESKKKSIFTPFLMMIAIIGPGIITANIDNDAGGIATYSLAGAQTGYRLLWIFLPITIALIMVQEMSARMGIVSGKGLADLIREKYGLKITVYTLLFLIIADIGNTMAEFAGIASAGEIFGISKYISIPTSAVLVWLLVIKGSYKIVERVFIFGCFIYLSYIISGFIANPNWNEVYNNILTPNFSKIEKNDFYIIVGLIGTSITPWMQFYIQASVVEKGISIKNLLFSRIDIIIGCIIMFLVTIFIVIACAATLHQSGTTILNVKDAALALEPLAGRYSTILFAIGLLNASLFSAALLPLATSYYVCEGMGWESGIGKTFKEAPNFFTIFTSIILFSSIFTLIPQINLFKILIWSQVINGVLIPLILLMIINLCNDPNIMGEYTNSKIYNFICKGIVFLMFIANTCMVYFEVL